MRKADNLQPSCAVVTKSRNLNFVDPSEPFQACNGTFYPNFKYSVFALSVGLFAGSFRFFNCYFPQPD